MRSAAAFLLSILVLTACEKENIPATPQWKLDRKDIATKAAIDSSQLVLTAWNPSAASAIELSQARLVSGFELEIQLIGLVWDSLVGPQFRLEVFNAADPSSNLCGVAVHSNAVYCYAGTEPDERDIRLISEHSGVLKIVRENGLITCSATLGAVELSYSDSIHMEDMGVRLVLGSTFSSTGKVVATLDDFAVKGGWAQSQISAPEVRSDAFDCERW